MATNTNKQYGLEEALQLKAKIELKKLDLNLTRVHYTNAKAKRITIDVPLETYTGIKMKVFSADISLREYVLDLINVDLK